VTTEQPWRGSPFSESLGARPVSSSDDLVVAELAIEDRHKNPTGAIHGGVMIALADNGATAMANRAHRAIEGDERFMVGIDLHATMLANQQGGTIRAESRVVRAGRRVVVIRTQVLGDGGRLLAEVTTTHIPA
jgi:1,4-dihydroxy-2-naphthoyl-CoA hydrolase